MYLVTIVLVVLYLMIPVKILEHTGFGKRINKEISVKGLYKRRYDMVLGKSLIIQAIDRHQLKSHNET